MAFWSGEKLAERLPDIFVGEGNFDESKIDCSAYTLTVGPEAYITPDHKVQNPSRHTSAKLNSGDSIAIPAGQFGFLLTEESITMPDDAMAFISMKSKLKFRGLINVSGFHVDPGFSGRLVFSVFNAGPKPLHVKRGDDLFLIWFSDLDRATDKKKSNSPLMAISSELINGISGEIQSAHSLSEKMELIEKNLAERTEEINRKLIKYTTVMGLLMTIVVGLGLYFIKDAISKEMDKDVQPSIEKNVDSMSAGPTSERMEKITMPSVHSPSKQLSEEILDKTPALPAGKQED